jgi:hypothetical protein
VWASENWTAHFGIAGDNSPCSTADRERQCGVEGVCLQRLTKEEIGVSKDEMGGDRCIGGLSNYVAEGRGIGFDVNTPSAKIISLTGVQVDKSITDQLKSGYVDCDGAAHYRYDLATDRMRLSSVKLNVPDPPDTAARDPQACFDRLVRQYYKNKKTLFNPDELKEFGRAFAAMCALNPLR